MFLNPDIEPCNIRCYFMDFLQTKKISSYIEYIKLICFIYESEGFDFELYKFKCENYELLSNNFCFIFEYNDQKMITDLQIVDKNMIVFEKDYYYMFKNIQCVNVKANLCILPCFENIPKDSISVQKEKIIKSIAYLKNNITKELKKNLSESKKQETNKSINFHEINFINENKWLLNFFDKQINIEIIKVYINDLNFRDFEILSDKESDFDVKNKLIRDWLCENSLTNKTNKGLNLNETNIEFLNLPTKVDSESINFNDEIEFVKIILHLFEQNQGNFANRNFEFPKAIKILYFYYDEKRFLGACDELRNYQYKYKSIKFFTEKILRDSDLIIESV